MQTCFNRLFDETVFPKLQLYESYTKLNENKSPVTHVNVESVVDGLASYDVVYSEPFMQCVLNDNKIDSSNPHATELWSSLKNLTEQSIIDKIINENMGSPPNYMLSKMEELKESVKSAKGNYCSLIYIYILYLHESFFARFLWERIYRVQIELSILQIIRKILFKCFKLVFIIYTVKQRSSTFVR